MQLLDSRQFAIAQAGPLAAPISLNIRDLPPGEIVEKLELVIENAVITRGVGAAVTEPEVMIQLFRNINFVPRKTSYSIVCDGRDLEVFNRLQNKTRSNFQTPAAALLLTVGLEIPLTPLCAPQDQKYFRPYSEQINDNPITFTLNMDQFLATDIVTIAGTVSLYAKTRIPDKGFKRIVGGLQVERSTIAQNKISFYNYKMTCLLIESIIAGRADHGTLTLTNRGKQIYSQLSPLLIDLRDYQKENTYLPDMVPVAFGANGFLFAVPQQILSVVTPSYYTKAIDWRNDKDLKGGIGLEFTGAVLPLNYICQGWKD